MANGNKIYEVKCPSCGAPLHMTGARITCDYCGAVLEREQPVEQPQTVSSKIQEPQVIVIQSGYSSVSSRRKSGGSSCLSGLFTLVLIVLIFGGVGWFRFRDQLSALAGFTDIASLAKLPEQLTNKATVTSLNRLTLLDSSNDTLPDFLTFTYQTSASTYALTYVNAVSSTIRWQGSPIKEWYSTRIILSPEIIYVTDETKLLALSREDGQVVWQTSMADKLAPSCSDCLALVDNRLVALVQGGTVQGFDAQSGQLLWDKRLNFEPTGRFVVAGSQLLIFDRTQDNRSNLMFVVNPLNGDSSDEIVLPECAGEFIDLHHPIIYDAERDQFYFISGGVIRPPCVQIWDVPTRQMVREVSLEGLALPPDFNEFVSEQSKAILSGGLLYFSATQKADSDGAGVLVELNPADGQWRVITTEPDYKLIPLTKTADLLIVRAIRTRGTERSELWGVDLASGEPRWQHVLQVSRWYKEAGSGAAWDWHLTSEGVSVLQIMSDPDQLTVETLNLQTGVSAGQKTIPVDDSFFSDIAWTNDAVWVSLRQIKGVDLNTGTVRYTWP